MSLACRPRSAEQKTSKPASRRPGSGLSDVTQPSRKVPRQNDSNRPALALEITTAQGRGDRTARTSKVRMTPGNGFAIEGLGRSFAIGELISRVGQAAIRGPSSTRPLVAFTSSPGVRLGQNLGERKCNLTLVTNCTNTSRMDHNAFVVPHVMSARQKSEKPPKNGLYTLFSPAFALFSPALVGADFGAFSAPLVEFSAPTGYKWLWSREFVRDIAVAPNSCGLSHATQSRKTFA